MMTSDANAPYADSELVIGLIAPTGANLDDFQANVETCLKEYRYEVSAIRLAELAREVVGRSPIWSNELERVTQLMDLGNEARVAFGDDVLALAACARINASRAVEAGARQPRARRVHLLRSLKHPAEVLALRRIYGPGFFLIGVVASEDSRRTYLRERRGCDDEEQLRALLKRDEHEGGLGQRTRDTFQLSDAFIRLGDGPALSRFFDLVFGSPHITPSKEEHAMFMAFAAGLRSADLSRQVGAVVTTPHGDLVGQGANDVPKAGGGLHWPGPEDDRDFKHGFDSNQKQRGEIVEEILGLLAPSEVDAEAWREAGRAKLATSRVMDMTEYGRPVHAEMEALLSCARSGISPQGATLYSTTLPCHNCAKHIIAAGIRRVVYVEPYPKSQALELYRNAIAEVEVDGETRVVFESFVGVGPRRFFDLFSIGLSTGWPVKRKDQDGNARSWQPSTAEARLALLPTSYIVREEAAAARLVELRNLRDEEPS